MFVKAISQPTCPHFNVIRLKEVCRLEEIQQIFNKYVILDQLVVLLVLMKLICRSCVLSMIVRRKNLIGKIKNLPASRQRG